MLQLTLELGFDSTMDVFGDGKSSSGGGSARRGLKQRR
jgi:hypothetical protein